MKKLKLGPLFWVLLAVCVVNMVGHLAVYPALPDTVPTHWGASGEVNGWSSKQSNLIFCVLPLVFLLFMEVVRRIDPKHQNFERFGKVWNIFITLFVLFTCGMTWLTELTVFDVLPGSSNMISIVVCGGIGEGAKSALASANIRLYGGVCGEADTAANALLAGLLEYAPAAHCAAHCAGHGEDAHCAGHGEDGSCAGHGEDGSCGGHGEGGSCGGHCGRH